MNKTIIGFLSTLFFIDKSYDNLYEPYKASSFILGIKNLYSHSLAKSPLHVPIANSWKSLT